MSKKIVLKLDLHDDKDKQKALKAVSKLHGLDSIAMDMKDKKLTAIGLIDPIDVVNKLRKYWRTEIVSVGPAKEPEKKKEDKKDDQKKENGKKEDKKKESPDAIADYINAYRAYYNAHAYNPQSYNSHMTPYYGQSAEENPNACVIC